MVSLDDLTTSLERESSAVVAEALPGGKDLARRGGSQRAQRRERGHEALVLGDHAHDLLLLEHDLGNEDGVGVMRMPPG